MSASRLSKIESRLKRLTQGHLALIEKVLDTFDQPIKIQGNSNSDVATSEFLTAFGDALKLHHMLSTDYLDKYRFEATMTTVLSAIGKNAVRPNRCNPGHDITVDGVPWSLKTQGDRGIKKDVLYISKFMELGKGQWQAASDLPGLRDRFLKHMNSYDRIFQLRYFEEKVAEQELGRMERTYELVEIPKSLLEKAKKGEFRWMESSTQSPKPGYCDVKDSQGRILFRLYFDGGTERKLQIKGLRKDDCILHATWHFS
jgi:hypothetical protein